MMYSLKFHAFFYNENLRVVISFLLPVNESGKAVKDSAVVRALNAKYLKSLSDTLNLKPFIFLHKMWMTII